MSDGEDGDAQDAPPQVDTKPNLDDEWPEDDVKPKKGKKGKKGGKKAAAEEDDVDMDAEPVVQATPAEALKPDLDEEWPEEDVKPKGKKGKKGKKVVEDDEDDWYVKQEEKKEEAPAVVGAAAPPQAKAAEAEPAGDDQEDENDDGPKVCQANIVCLPLISLQILTKAQKEKLKKEKEKVSYAFPYVRSLAYPS